MKSHLAIAALAAALTTATAAGASAGERHGTVTGPRGTATVDAYGSCSNGSCSRSITRTGPYGYQMNRQGSASCQGSQCSGTRTTTGPHGNTVTRSGTWTRY